MGHAWDYTVQLYQHHGVNWTIWTYKGSHGTGTDYWGVYNPKDPVLPKPDIKRDSAAVIKSKWSEWTTGASFALNPNHLRNLALPVPADDHYICGETC